MCPFLSYSTPEAATEAAWRPFLAPVSPKASLFLSTEAGALAPASDERRHVGVHLLQDLHVERHAGPAVVGDWVERQPRQRVVALEHVPERLY